MRAMWSERSYEASYAVSVWGALLPTRCFRLWLVHVLMDVLTDLAELLEVRRW